MEQRNETGTALGAAWMYRDVKRRVTESVLDTGPTWLARGRSD